MNERKCSTVIQPSFGGKAETYLVFVAGLGRTNLHVCSEYGVGWSQAGSDQQGDG